MTTSSATVPTKEAAALLSSSENATTMSLTTPTAMSLAEESVCSTLLCTAAARAFTAAVIEALVGSASCRALRKRAGMPIMSLRNASRLFFACLMPALNEQTDC